MENSWTAATAAPSIGHARVAFVAVTIVGFFHVGFAAFVPLVEVLWREPDPVNRSILVGVPLCAGLWMIWRGGSWVFLLRRIVLTAHRSNGVLEVLRADGKTCVLRERPSRAKDVILPVTSPSGGRFCRFQGQNGVLLVAIEDLERFDDHLKGVRLQRQASAQLNAE